MEITVVILEYIGVASAAITGTMVGIERRAAAFGVLFLAMLTAVGGGMIRDMLTNAMPKVLYKRIYAIASVAGGLLYYGFLRLGLNKTVGALIAIAFIVTLRILATKFRWNLPHAEP